MMPSFISYRTLIVAEVLYIVTNTKHLAIE